MGRYCSVDQVAARFRKVTDVISYPTAVDSQFIVFAEAELDRRLGAYFTVPFSSNNLTATDLSIDLSYAKVIKYDDPEKYAAIIENVDGVIEGLIKGDAAMVLDDGTTMFSSDSAGTAWSNTASYHSAFGMGDELNFAVDRDQVYDEDQAR